MGRQLRTRLDLLHPDISDRVQRQACKSNKPIREFLNGDVVSVRDYRDGSRKGVWTRGTVYRKVGPCTYQIAVDNCLIWKRHINQLRQFTQDEGPSDDVNSVPTTSASNSS